MELSGKVVVVTGGAGGIGKAMATKFISEGAKSVVIVDINQAMVEKTAQQIGAHAMTADVANEQDIIRIVEDTESRFGAIDLFCSNAGIARGASPMAPNDEWQSSWDINVMSHVYAARHLLPRMIARGGGYFLNTASAAGLLNQIGGAAYGVSKHAAVGFAEWLAFTHAHEGIKVSVLCPQAVRTAMTETMEEGTKAASVDGMLEADTLADIVVENLREENFLILTHPEVKEYMQRKASDYGRWIGGMNRLLKRIMGIAD